MTSRRNRVSEHLVSIVIVTVLGCQLAAVALRVPKRTWPFVDYPMYSSRHEAGDLIHRLTLEVGLEDGRDIMLDPNGEILGEWRFRHRYFEAIRCLGDKAHESLGATVASGSACVSDAEQYRERLAQLARVIEERHGDGVRHVTIVDRPVQVQRTGPVTLTPRRLVSVAIPRRGQQS